MSTEAVHELALEPGSVAVAVVKATTVIVEAPRPGRGSTMTIVGRTRLVVAAATLALAASGCGAGQPVAGGSTAPTTVTVFAAASMKSAFTSLGQQFEAAHPGTKAAFNYAGSQALAEQILNGAPADAFASADSANMKKVTDAGLNAAAPSSMPRISSRSRCHRTTPRRSRCSTTWPGPGSNWSSAPRPCHAAPPQ